jgi:hypothetical protein
MDDMIFEVSAPAEEQPKKGGKQTKRQVQVTVLDLQTMTITLQQQCESVYEATKLGELFHSRSTVAAALRTKGHYTRVTGNKLVVLK